MGCLARTRKATPTLSRVSLAVLPSAVGSQQATLFLNFPRDVVLCPVIWRARVPSRPPASVEERGGSAVCQLASCAHPTARGRSRSMTEDDDRCLEAAAGREKKGGVPELNLR